MIAAGRESSRRQVIPDISNLYLCMHSLRITWPSRVLRAYVRAFALLRILSFSSPLLFTQFSSVHTVVLSLFRCAGTGPRRSEEPRGSEKVLTSFRMCQEGAR